MRGPAGSMDGMKIELPDGATIEYLTPIAESEPCVMRGSIPAGGVVPLHSHADPETFLVLEGEALSYTGDWQPVEAGDVVHIPGHVRHAWRNHTRHPVVMHLVTTAPLARFFAAVAADPDRFLEISDRYGYWNATPEENADVGLQITAVG
jgi:quercetin dioxygenase-like cupin family protein